MAKVVYGFKDKAAAQRAAQYFGQNPQDQNQQGLYSDAAPSRIRLVEVPDGIDGYNTPMDDVEFPESEVEIIRTTTNPQELLSETTGSNGFHSVMAAPLEPTNYPAEARVVAVTDSFNQTFLLTPTPSEVFGTLYGMYDAERYRVQLDQGFTVNGDGELGAYPSPTLEEIPEAGSAVTCRYIKSLGKWFFFKPTAGGKVIDVYGQVLNVTSSEGTAFYSEMAAGESVASASYPLSITAAPKSQEATGSDTADVWIKFPTVFVTLDETPVWWRKGTNDSTTLYQWETLVSGVRTFHAAPVKYYGNVIKGSSGFYLPKYRTINGQRYWELESGGSYIYYTRKDSDLGYCIGSVLGKFLTTADSEPFAAQTSYPEDALAALMTAQGLTYEKPEWTSSSQFGNYTANASASGTVQFGCGRWIASDGRTLSPPFRFVHAADGTAKKWRGSYTCQAFDVKFSGLNYGTDPVTESAVYFIGDLNAAAGCYTSASAPSTSGSVTFTYRDDGTRGLKANFRYVDTTDGTERWWLETSAEDRTDYTRPEGGTTFTPTGSFRSCFGNITKSGSTWTVAGVNATVGTLEFTGDLSTEEPNIFRFKHSITLTFEDYIQGTESKGVLICSPGVIS